MAIAVPGKKAAAAPAVAPAKAAPVKKGGKVAAPKAKPKGGKKKDC
jgi:hypothetical protein